eukprot:scaffold55396_cov63-Phaeocystis_antarctica.AAC.1
MENKKHGKRLRVSKRCKRTSYKYVPAQFAGFGENMGPIECPRARLSNADAARTEQVRHLDVARLVGPHEAVPHREVRHD